MAFIFGKNPTKGTSDRRFSISLLLSIGPIVGIIVMAFLTTKIVQDIKNINGSLVQVQVNVKNAQKRAREASTAMQTVASDLYALVSWLTLKGKQEDIERMEARIASNLEILRLLSLKDPELIPEDTIKEFTQKISVSLRMTKMTPGIGFGSVVQLSKRIDAAINNILEVADKRANQTELSLSSSMKTMNSLITFSIIASIALTCLLIASAFFSSKSVISGIKNLTNVMTELANGNHKIIVPCLDRSDEILDMAKAVEIFKKHSMENEQLQLEKEQEVIRQNSRSATLTNLISDFDNYFSDTLKKLTNESLSLETTATDLTENSGLVNQKTKQVSSAAANMDESVNFVSSTAHSLSTSLQAVRFQVNESAEIASKASKQAIDTNKQMEKLINVAADIDDVINLISSVAERTNLLALNATIEAARAGEAGKGFAVVAAEVKNLASQTSDATNQISDKIQSIQTETKVATDSIGGIISIIHTIDSVTSGVANAMIEQTKSTTNIASSIEEAAKNTQAVSLNIHEVSNRMNQTNDASNNVLSTAYNFKVETDKIQDQYQIFSRKIKTL